MLTRLRNNINEIINKIAKICRKLRIAPNYITLLGLILSLFAIPSALFKNYPLLFLIIVTSSFMDVLDGAVARLNNQITTFGGVLDSVCDRIEESIFLFSLYFVGIDMPLLFIAFVISYTISYLRALGEIRGVKMEGIGLLERGERIILIAITILLLMFIDTSVAFLSLSIYKIPIILLIILGTITMIQRIHYLYHKLQKTK
jgi:archaetidylinositol phosphate synthase